MTKRLTMQWTRNLIKGSRDVNNDIEIKRKTILAYVISLIGVMALIPLGLLAFTEAKPSLGYFDLLVAVILIVNCLCLRRTGYHIYYSYFGLFVAGALFVYLFASGGVSNTGNLWYYTYPLITSFFLGSKRGAILTSALFGIAIFVFFLEDYSSIITTYSKSFKIRFVFSFLVVSGMSYFYEYAREKAQQKLVQQKTDLEKLVHALNQSDTKQKETSLLLEAVLDGIPDVIGIQDRYHGIIRYNAAGYEFLGTSKEEIKGKKCYELIGRKTPCDACATTKSYKTKKPAGIEKYDADSGIWLDVRSYPILNKQGEISYVVEHLRDITKEKRAEEELRQTEERYRSLVENTIEGFFICEIPSGTFLFLNQRACDMYGYTLEEGLTHTIWDIISAADHERVKNRIQARMEGKRLSSERQVYNSVRKDQSTLRVDISSSSVTFEDHLVVQGVIRDITEQEQLEQQLQQSKKMEAIGLLAGGVAHDLNNVLSGVVTYPELLLMDLPEDAPLRKPIQRIHSSGKKAAEIVQDLLTLARRGVKNKAILNLNDVIHDYLKSPEHEKIASLHSSVLLKTRLDGNLMNIEGSATQLTKMVMNLILNAAEAQLAGGGIAISTRNQYVDIPIQGYEIVKEGEYIVLEVKDLGSGIAPEDMTRIFEPFFTKKVMGRSGTGLGMAVVWGTIHDHEGHINIESMEGEGTTFSLFFPVSRGKEIPEQAIIPVERYLGDNQTILVVDDVDEQREIASSILTRLNYRVRSVSTGEDALAYLQAHSADILVLDMIMEPGIDGLETYRRIKKINPNQKVIIASGYSETERVKEAQRLGAGKYIRKPYTYEEIGMAIKEALEN